MHEVCTFQLRTVTTRIESVERKLDFLEASLKHVDPAQRQIQNGDIDTTLESEPDEKNPRLVAGSIFERSTRYTMVRQKVVAINEKRQTLKYNNRTIRPLASAANKQHHVVNTNTPSHTPAPQAPPPPMPSSANMIPKRKVSRQLPKPPSGQTPVRVSTSSLPPGTPELPAYPVSRVSVEGRRSTLKLKDPEFQKGMNNYCAFYILV